MIASPDEERPDRFGGGGEVMAAAAEGAGGAVARPAWGDGVDHGNELIIFHCAIPGKAITPDVPAYGTMTLFWSVPSRY
jgi:hypothetical protein